MTTRPSFRFRQKPDGSHLLPSRHTKEEFEAADIKDKKSLYTVIRRDSAGKLYSIPYSKFYAKHLQKRPTY